MKIRSFIINTAVFLMIFLIFTLSTQDAPTSNHLSQGVTHTLTLTLEKLPLAKNAAPPSNSQIRDLAHIGLFFILGVICMLTSLLQIHSYKKAAIFTLFVGAITALCDELIQIGSIGRAFEWIDMGKDMLGIIASILIVGITYKLLRIRSV